MNALQLIHEAKQAGVDIWCEGEQLRFKGNRQATSLVLPGLREHKAELLAYLQATNELEPTTPTPEKMVDIQADYWQYLQPKQRDAVARYRASDDSLHELLRMVVFAKQADGPRNIRTTLHGVVLLWQGYQWQDQSELMGYWHGRALKVWASNHQ